jgi:hypothetical protein
MKSISRLVVLAVFSASAPLVHADAISLGSFATGTTAASLGFSSSQTAMNFAGFTPYATPPPIGSTPTLLNGTANTYTLVPGSTWLAPTGNSTWVGYAPTAGPLGTNPPYGYYQFTTDFTAVGGLYAGTISLMADDTAEVLLNGVPIVPFHALGSDTHCADTSDNCTVPDNVSLTGLTLLAGNDANVLTFIVEQAGSEGNTVDPSGMDFTASLVGNVGNSPVPEPSTLLLLGTSLLGGATIVRVRKAA